MYYAKPQSQVEIDKNDLQTFKNLTLIFALSRIFDLAVGFVTNGFNELIKSLISATVNYGGIICLVYGIYLLSSKYPKLMSGMKIVYLFLSLLAILIIRSFYNILYPTQVNSSDLSSLSDKILSNYLPGLIFVVIIGILTLITAYYLTEWLNIIFGFFNPTRAYFYYGLFFCIGSIIIDIGVVLFAQNFDFSSINSTSNATSTSAPVFTSGAIVGLLILIVGGFSLISAIILEIVAGFKIYNRANDLWMGKTMPRGYQQPYQPTYQQQYQPTYNQSNTPYSNQPPYQNQNQSIYQNPNQPPYQDPNKNPNKTYDNSYGRDNNTNPTSTSAKFCKYCGAGVQTESKFCQSCGAKVD